MIQSLLARLAPLCLFAPLCLLAPAVATPAAPALVAEDPPDLDPASGEGEPGTVYQWRSENGLRFTWLLPDGFSAEQAYDVTVILHGTGLDYRWGHWNHPTGVFRPRDIVISVDGPTKDGDSRLFLGEKADGEAVQEFLKELRASFPVDDLFLYGHSQGGFFAIWFAGEYPEDISGAVAHASGAWNWSKMGRDVKKVPLAFLHGTRDPVVPYRQSLATRDAYAEEGFELLHLRRMQGYNHWPNAVRANEVIGWCDGMATEDPEEALSEALEILREKPADQYSYQTPVGYAAARDVLRRLVGDGPRPFDEVDSGVERKARTWIKAIEEAGAAQVSILKKQVGSKKALRLAEGEWLGHLLAVREDFRGVDTVEAYVDKVGFDAVTKKQAKARKAILEAYYGQGDKAERYAEIVEQLADGFLYEGYPPDLLETLRKWEPTGADRKQLSKKARAGAEDLTVWESGLKDGQEAYGKLWKRWEGPED